MREDILRRLRRVTEEEERLLAGGEVDKGLYSSGSGFIIDSEKLLAKGQLITLRPHTRFASFPPHSHNYVEIMYMCSGQTVHRLEGQPPLTLRAGELLFLDQNAVHSVDEAGEGDVGVNFIVLPQFFDRALTLIGVDNVLGKFLLNSLKRGGSGIDHMHFLVSDVPPVQNLVENLVWSLVNPAAQRAPHRPDDHGSAPVAASQPHARHAGRLRQRRRGGRAARGGGELPRRGPDPSGRGRTTSPCPI